MRKLERWAEETGADWVGRAGSCLGHIQQATGVLLMSYAEKRQLCTDLNTRRAKYPPPARHTRHATHDTTRHIRHATRDTTRAG
jgi:hypothetical protein